LRFRIHTPPLPRKIAERLAPRIEEVEIAEATATTQFRIERFGISLAIEVSRTVPVSLAPAN
jgi:hypothetical protein